MCDIRQKYIQILSVLFLLCILIFSRLGFADTHPLPVNFHSIETTHFYVHFPQEMQEYARYAASVAEEAHARLSVALEWLPREKTHVVITAFQDEANGWALGQPYNLIHLYAYAPETTSELSDYDDWIRQLLYHEYVHTLHIDTILGPHRVLNTIFGKFAANNATLPRWYTEGLAVTYESRFSNAGRLKSTLYRLMLRNAALNKAIPSLSQLSQSPIEWPAGSASYLFGAFFIQYMAKTYGFSSLNEFQREYAKQLIPFGLNRMALRVWNKDWVSLYDEWIKSATSIAEKEREEIQSFSALTPHQNLDIPPHRHRQPQFRPKHDHEISFLYQSGYGRQSISLYNRETKKMRTLIECWGNCEHRWSENGKRLYFIHTVLDRGKYSSNELFSYNMENGELRQLSKKAHVKSFDLEDEGQLSFIYVHQFGAKIELRRLNVKENSNETLYVSHFLESLDDIYVDSTKVYASRHFQDTQSRDLAVFDLTEKDWTRLSKDKSLDLFPFRSKSGDVYFVSDRSKEFNLYKIDTDNVVFRLSNFDAGIFNPSFNEDESEIVYVAYTHLGSEIRISRSSDLSPSLAQESTRTSLLVYPKLLEIKNESRTFWAARHLMPRSWFPSLSLLSNRDVILGLSFKASDPTLQHHYQVALSGALQSFNHKYAFQYTYTALSWDLGIFLSYSGGESYFFDGFRSKAYDEGVVSGSFVASTTVSQRLATHQFTLAYSLLHFQNLHSLTWELDPDSYLPRLPEFGFHNTLSASWILSDARQFEKSITRSSGYVINLNLSMRAPWLGARNYGFFASASVRAYLTMPYLKIHSLAIRLAGASSWTQNKIRPSYTLNTDTQFQIDSLLYAQSASPVLRGYPAGILQGSHYLYANLEYRLLIFEPQWAHSTLPLELRRISAAIFSDWAYAWRGSPDFNLSKLALGAELWLDLNLGYRLSQRLRLGYAWGASALGSHQFYLLLGQEF